MNFYISDLHFGHKNIIGFDERPYYSVEEMEESLVKNWNSVVGEHDTVYHLGDFVWSKNPDEWCRILDMLNGNKVIIQGNHDLKNYPSNLKSRISEICQIKEITDNGKHIIMSHYPMLLYKGSYNPDVIMLCGHVHTTREDNLLNSFRGQLWDTQFGVSDNDGNILNVGCMKSYMKYTPRNIEYLTSVLDNLRKEHNRGRKSSPAYSYIF